MASIKLRALLGENFEVNITLAPGYVLINQKPGLSLVM